MPRARVTVLGIFVADLTFVADRLPRLGETLIGEDFRIGPGGKGSNQAVAAARAGAAVSLIARIGRDTFGDMARSLLDAEGIDGAAVLSDDATPTGAAAILVDAASGDNAIVVVPGAAGAITPDDVAAAEAAIANADVFATQFEVALPVVRRGLAIARHGGTATILNPAPAVANVPAALYALSDYFTPNETEAADLAGVPVNTVEEAEAAADVFLQRGVGAAIVTLGAGGAFVKSSEVRGHVPAMDAGPVVETTGAGDAFNGALAVAVAEGRALLNAVRFATAAAAISVTRPGTAPSMPARAEIDALAIRMEAG
jgi:ribokinase